jgi:hypothetical protein
MKMLEFEKMILEKVSFDPALFEKEFRKAAGRLVPGEMDELKKWCSHRFPPMQPVQEVPLGKL